MNQNQHIKLTATVLREVIHEDEKWDSERNDFQNEKYRQHQQQDERRVWVWVSWKYTWENDIQSRVRERELELSEYHVCGEKFDQMKRWAEFRYSSERERKTVKTRQPSRECWRFIPLHSTSIHIPKNYDDDHHMQCDDDETSKPRWWCDFQEVFYSLFRILCFGFLSFPTLNLCISTSIFILAIKVNFLVSSEQCRLCEWKQQKKSFQIFFSSLKSYFLFPVLMDEWILNFIDFISSFLLTLLWLLASF